MCMAHPRVPTKSPLLRYFCVPQQATSQIRANFLNFQTIGYIVVIALKVRARAVHCPQFSWKLRVILGPMSSPSTSRLNSASNLLSRVDWRRVSTAAQRELHNREIHAPVVSAFRWWARRPHSVMGAILDAAVDTFGDDMTVSDPFSGGGTVTFEATRRGLKAYAQDLYPWPTIGLATALKTVDRHVMERAASALLEQLKPLRALYCTPQGSELSHVIRVRSTTCACCRKRYFLFPEALVSAASRTASEKHAYFGCASCGAVAQRSRSIASFGCSACGDRFETGKPLTGCPHCGQPRGDFVGDARPEHWHAVLVQELRIERKQLRARLRLVEPSDPVNFISASGLHSTLAAPLAAGIETQRLLDAGFRSWGDLYTERQARAIFAALEHVSECRESLAVKDRLALAIIGAAEMPALVSRWDRYHLKPFEATANHRYYSGTFVVECNPLSPVGRGTLPRRLARATKAIHWLAQSSNPTPRVVSTVPGRVGRRPTRWDVLVATGSSRTQALRDGAANIVLTDPPYFSDVQYGELARLFHVWLSIYSPLATPDENLEAVPNAVRGVSAGDYEATVAQCLAESRRTLRADGRLILTFHNKKLAAWRALAGALHRAGFDVRAMAVVHAENGNDHCKREVNAMLHDLVLECAPAAGGRHVPTLAFEPKSAAEKNLAAIGLSVAESIRAGDSSLVSSLYKKRIGDMRGCPQLIG